MTVLAPYLKQRFVDNNGAALFNGTVSTFAAGTNTPIATYTDSTGLALNTNPIVLNFRGECDIWLLPNVAYKFLVQDVLGNTIWTEDNVVQSQLITLYGGTDTGSANAYLLNFTANFTAYTDGIVVYWTPAHTNSGASTININGLGVINIVNGDGSALIAGEIVANQPATILIRSGQAVLTTSAIPASSTFTTSWTGFSAAPATTTIAYRKIGQTVTLLLPVQTGTSNSTSFQMSLPAALLPVGFNSASVPIAGLTDNSVAVTTVGTALISASASGVVFSKDGSGTNNWTAAGSKGFSGPAGGVVEVSYSL